MPALRPKTFNKIAERLFKEQDGVYSIVLGEIQDEEMVLDMAISCDGTWLTTGHQSHIGIGFVIDVLTGLAIDSHVALAPDHKEEGCAKNFDGTASMIDIRVAEFDWERSVDRNKRRYVIVVSDGDSKAYNKICDIAPYGKTGIEKDECLNHVGKGLGDSTEEPSCRLH
ncbi:hypothetical protein RRG08_012545 [Elysia crispata]|uniref:Mutator-like transposase domain-containing protein n=1 Tax=Elysia crispata TaxID=231223 RepID=A0AAE1AP88_9GAST|nr:hypothetical protein RRG08_012545 [Elysia crispata]